MIVSEILTCGSTSLFNENEVCKNELPNDEH